MKRFYLTTTLPYVNSVPHIGHGMEFVRADVIARYKRLRGYDVFFNTGTDEHGQKIYEGAIKENLTTQEYVDKYSQVFKDFHKLFNISYNSFIRTTDKKHIDAAIKMWNICLNRGDIYKATQEIKYCVGCEMEKTDSELIEGKCPDHPNRELIITQEENYFFRFSKYQDALIDLYDRGLVKPEFRSNEIRNFVSAGLHDFSVSRLKSKMPWGVPVPNDDNHVMYVWFDALTSYIACLDWAYDGEDFAKYWVQDGEDREVVQYCGKDNNKAQSAIWQSMLFSSGLPNTKTININGHIISGGVKMSKSIGNVISPFDIYNKYKESAMFPEDVFRFVMCHDVSTYEDSDITLDTIHSSYVANLQNGIGNQLNRILKLSQTHIDSERVKQIIDEAENMEFDAEYSKLLDEFKINEAINLVALWIRELDEYIQDKEPFKLIKEDSTKEEAKDIILNSIRRLIKISYHLYIFTPSTSEFIYNQIKLNQMPDKPLYNRL